MGNRYTRRLVAIAATMLTFAGGTPSVVAQDADSIAITAIDLTTDTVSITNNGSAEFDPNGLILCNFPTYVPITGADPIAPGESVTVDAAALGVPLGDDQGELGLYTASEFENPDAIIAYVEWGTADHRRSPVAVAAGIWDGTPVDAGALLEATVDAPTSSLEWAASDPAPAGDTDGDDTDGDDTDDSASDDAQALPQTGATTAIIALVATTLLAVGVALAVAGRRRSIAGN